jgi:hypothetical protein
VSAVAQSVITIDARSAPYNTVGAAQGVGVRDEFAVRVAAITALAGAYKTTKGPFYILKEGQVFEFKATLNKSILDVFSGRESEVNSDSLPPNQALACLIRERHIRVPRQR